MKERVVTMEELNAALEDLRGGSQILGPGRLVVANDLSGWRVAEIAPSSPTTTPPQAPPPVEHLDVDLVAASDRAFRFLAGLGERMFDGAAAEQREYLAVVHDLKRALRPEIDASADEGDKARRRVAVCVGLAEKYLGSHPDTPRLTDVEMEYQPYLETTPDIGRMLETYTYDVDSITAWRIAELHKKGIAAEVYMQSLTLQGGHKVWRLFVRYPDGRLECPHALMETARQRRWCPRPEPAPPEPMQPYELSFREWKNQRGLP